MARPLVLTVLGWLAVLWGLSFVLDLLFRGADPVRALLAAVVYVACGLGLLAGREWARMLWILAWIGPGIAGLNLFRLSVAGVSIFLLFLPRVSEYIVAVSSGGDPADD